MEPLRPVSSQPFGSYISLDLSPRSEKDKPAPSWCSQGNTSVLKSSGSAQATAALTGENVAFHHRQHALCGDQPHQRRWHPEGSALHLVHGSCNLIAAAAITAPAERSSEQQRMVEQLTREELLVVLKVITLDRDHLNCAHAARGEIIEQLRRERAILAGMQKVIDQSWAALEAPQEHGQSMDMSCGFASTCI